MDSSPVLTSPTNTGSNGSGNFGVKKTLGVKSIDDPPTSKLNIKLMLMCHSSNFSFLSKS